jgi:HEAT repeat protein
MSSQKIRRSVKRFVSSKAPSMKLLATVLVTLVLAVAAAQIGHQRQAASKAAASAIEGDNSFYRFTIGERLIYRLDYTNTSASDFQKLFAEKESSGKTERSAPSGLAHSFSTTVQGELVATILDNRNDTLLLTFSVRNAVVSINTNGQVATTEAETVRVDISRDIFARLDLSGRVLAVCFDPSTNSLSQSFARALLAMTQLVFPGAPVSDLKQWEAQEEDTTGPYIARYEAQTGTGNCEAQVAPAVKTFRKTKARYLSSPAQAGTKPGTSEFDIPTTINPGGQLSAAFDFQQGRLICLTGKESQTVAMAGKAVAQAETTIGLNYVSKENLSATEISALRKASLAREKVATSVPLSAKASEQESEAAIQRTELGEATIESLLIELAHLETSGDETKDEAPLYLKFKALVYLQPQASALLGEILATSHPGSATTRILTGALGAAGHTQAQEALVSAIRARREDWPALSTLIPVLGSVDLPTPLAEEALREFASNSPDWNIASTAQLALGVMARSLAESERAAKLVDWAVKNLDSSPSAEMTKQWLLVLGNTGSATALPGIARFVHNPSPELRAVAASALRFIKSRQADDLLIKILTSDSEAKVRLEAAIALSFREPGADSFAAQKKAFLRDKTVNVRLAVLKNLWQARETFFEIRQLVKQAAAKDVAKEVRKAAAEMMAPYSKGFLKS